MNVNAIRCLNRPYHRTYFTFFERVAAREAETVKLLRFDFAPDGQLLEQSICSVPSHTINDVCTGIRSQFITEVELINFLRSQRKREMRHLPVLGQFH